MVNFVKHAFIVALVFCAATVQAESFEQHRLQASFAEKAFPKYYSAVSNKNFRALLNSFKCYYGKYYLEDNSITFVFDISPNGEVTNLRSQPDTPEAQCIAKIVSQQRFDSPPAYPIRNGFPISFVSKLTPPPSKANLLPVAEDKEENNTIRDFFGGCRFMTEKRDELVLTGSGITWEDCINQSYKVLKHEEDMLVLEIDEASSCLNNLGINLVKIEREEEKQFAISFYLSEAQYLKDKPGFEMSCDRLLIFKTKPDKHTARQTTKFLDEQKGIIQQGVPLDRQETAPASQ